MGVRVSNDQEPPIFEARIVKGKNGSSLTAEPLVIMQAAMKWWWEDNKWGDNRSRGILLGWMLFGRYILIVLTLQLGLRICHIRCTCLSDSDMRLFIAPAMTRLSK